MPQVGTCPRCAAPDVPILPDGTLQVEHVEGFADIWGWASLDVEHPDRAKLPEQYLCPARAGMRPAERLGIELELAWLNRQAQTLARLERHQRNGDKHLALMANRVESVAVMRSWMRKTKRRWLNHWAQHGTPTQWAPDLDFDPSKHPVIDKPARGLGVLVRMFRLGNCYEPSEGQGRSCAAWLKKHKFIQPVDVDLLPEMYMLTDSGIMAVYLHGSEVVIPEEATDTIDLPEDPETPDTTEPSEETQ